MAVVSEGGTERRRVRLGAPGHGHSGETGAGQAGQRGVAGRRVDGRGRTAPLAESVDVAALRELALRGDLTTVVATADDAGRRRLTGAAITVAYPVVYDVLTRRNEFRRGHGRCATAVQHLADGCLDRFHDDVESVVDYLLSQARQPIDNLEGWLASRAAKAAVDGHRKRRGRRGALQRPRMTKALIDGLGADPWLRRLALDILTWVGVPATAGTGIWPLESWAQRRAQVTGDYAGSDPATVQREVDFVLGVLGRQPDWYAEHVERPLGRKVAPVAPPPGDGPTDTRPLRPVPGYEVDEARLADLAGTAVEVIAARLRRGADPTETVRRVLGALFVDGSGSEEIDRVPAAGPAAAERVSALLTDSARLRTLVGEVLDILGHRPD